MAIYGLNFNTKPIPTILITGQVTDGPASAPRLLFPRRLKLNARTGRVYGVGADKACDYLLSGVCNTDDELADMMAQASNGHRTFHIIRRKGWIAVYTG